jgi:hypothetical protein
MVALRTLAGPVCAAALLLGALTGCGDETHLPVVPTATPFLAGSVAVTQMGNADITIDARSVTFMLDPSRSLVVHLTLVSTAAAPVTVSIRASIYDPSHNIIGDATGANVTVPPNQPTSAQLTGPNPLGTIAAATFEVTGVAPPT